MCDIGFWLSSDLFNLHVIFCFAAVFGTKIWLREMWKREMRGFAEKKPSACSHVTANLISLPGLKRGTEEVSNYSFVLYLKPLSNNS